MLAHLRNDLIYTVNVACVFAGFLVSFVLAWWFNNLYLIPAFQFMRQPVIGLLLTLWLGVYFIFYRRMGLVERTVVFFLFILISLFSVFVLLVVDGGHIRNCTIEELVHETEVIYVCELTGSGWGTFRVQIDSPVMELLDFS